ncbi:hypothetical protein ACI1AD_004202 [Cronobacter dublinensis]
MHYDRFGRLTTLINPNRESWRFEYGATGRLTRRQGKNGVGQHFAYDEEQRVKEIGFERDSEFRKVKYRYDPVAGRNTQMDAIGLAGGMNTYSYVGDLLTWVDPLGLMNCGSDAVLLRQNMIREGIEEPSFQNCAHHIVMSNSSDVRMVALRPKIEDFGLDINGYCNGVFYQRLLKLWLLLEQTCLRTVKSTRKLINKMFMKGSTILTMLRTFFGVGKY